MLSYDKFKSHTSSPMPELCIFHHDTILPEIGPMTPNWDLNSDTFATSIGY